jgi:hypothetical protein
MRFSGKLGICTLEERVGLQSEIGGIKHQL